MFLKKVDGNGMVQIVMGTHIEIPNSLDNLIFTNLTPFYRVYIPVTASKYLF